MIETWDKNNYHCIINNHTHVPEMEDDGNDGTTKPTFYGDWWVIHAMFIEMSKNYEIDWKRRCEFKDMELCLRDPSARSYWLFRGDAITSWLAAALASCAQAPFMWRKSETTCASGSELSLDTQCN
jgi:hypothetical protein